MFDMKGAVFLCCCLSVVKATVEVASFIDPCPYDDAACTLKSANKALPYFVKGLPEFGVPSFDPLVVGDIKASNGDLLLEFENMVIKGLPECNITKAERIGLTKVNVELITPIFVTGDYKVDGKFYLVPVEGHGKCEIKTAQIKIGASINMKKIEKDGEEYYKFTGFDYSFEPLKKVYFKFYDLYGGDKAKAEPIESILDENWKEIMNDVAKPVVKEIIAAVVNAVGKFFSTVPCNQLEKS